jgi:pentatricopeptide repeat protein
VIYNILINSMCSVGKLSTARELFNTFLAKGVQPNVWTYNIMIKRLWKKGLLVEASELFEKMEKSYCSPDHVTYNAIVQGFLQHNEKSWAVKYLQMMVDNHGNHFD